MSGKRSGGGPDERETITWATERVPLALRKELLERELKKLGLRKAAAQDVAREDGAPQQQCQSDSSHPRADDDAGGDRHGD